MSSNNVIVFWAKCSSAWFSQLGSDLFLRNCAAARTVFLSNPHDLEAGDVFVIRPAEAAMAGVEASCAIAASVREGGGGVASAVLADSSVVPLASPPHSPMRLLPAARTFRCMEMTCLNPITNS